MGIDNETFCISDENGDMFYAVLWLPPRFKVLGLYLLLVPVFIGLIAIDKAWDPNEHLLVHRIKMKVVKNR